MPAQEEPVKQIPSIHYKISHNSHEPTLPDTAGQLGSSGPDCHHAHGAGLDAEAIVHELIHLLEPTHNARFQVLMDQHMPKWRSHQQTLNRLPVRQKSWGY